MALRVEENVAVVPILDREHVTHHGVGGEGRGEVPLGFRYARREGTVRHLEVRGQSRARVLLAIHPLLLLQLPLFESVNRDRVGQDLDRARGGIRCDDPVGLEVEGQARFLKDTPTELNQLQCTDLLPKVVVRFDDHTDEVPAWPMPLRRLSFNAGSLRFPALAERQRKRESFVVGGVLLDLPLKIGIFIHELVELGLGYRAVLPQLHRSHHRVRHAPMPRAALLAAPTAPFAIKGGLHREHPAIRRPLR
mmetsp:Transcript_32302/g.74679  ORF Transcript_32302/g.74679 Transcript_32302/m.74679 type:complete len:250 (-) Transcript_32302:397-1146(-)